MKAPVLCLDNAGEPIDWWVQYKAPGDCDTGNAPWRRGNSTLYVDARTLGDCAGGACWARGSIDAYDGALQRTLAQLPAAGTGVAMYSDQPPVYPYNYA